MREPVAGALEEHTEEIVTIADILRAQGFERGEQQGVRDTLLDLLGERFGAPPEEVLERIRTVTLSELCLWARRVVTAPTLADVLADA